MKNKTHLVLCVDDEAVGLRVRKILLERAGYQVLTAADGPAGLELFATQPVDAVILDYSMPGNARWRSRRKMRQIKPEVPILLLSAYVGLPDEVSSSGRRLYDQRRGCAGAARQAGQPACPPNRISSEYLGKQTDRSSQKRDDTVGAYTIQDEPSGKSWFFPSSRVFCLAGVLVWQIQGRTSPSA